VTTAAGHNLPASLPPRGLSEPQAAAYVGVSPDTFRAEVKAGRLPQPVRLGRRVVWDRLALDRAMDALSALDRAERGVLTEDPWLERLSDEG
jgi:predicted DNA-binding transcriptional regulator AlpA